MNHIIEKDWITKSGLRAVVLRATDYSPGHRCGYVGINNKHPFLNVYYERAEPTIKQKRANKAKVGKKMPFFYLQLLFVSTTSLVFVPSQI